MSDKPDNPPVYPSGDHKGIEPDFGMSLRDYFAGQIAPVFAIELAKGEGGLRLARGGKLHVMTAEAAFMVADAMLAERLK